MKSILFIILLVGWVVWGFRWMIGINRRSVPSCCPDAHALGQGAQQDTKEKEKTPDQPSR